MFVLVVKNCGVSFFFVGFDSNMWLLQKVTYGILAEVESHPYCSSEEMVLMDWSSGHLSGEENQANEREPSFLYVMPFSESLLFLEETSLVDRPEVRSDNLKERLTQRLQFLGIKVRLTSNQ